MKVLVMDTGRGIGDEKVATWRAHLGLEAVDQLILVSWFPPRAKAPLPLTAHLVCGPVLRLGQEPVRWQVRSGDEARDEDRRSSPASGTDVAGAADEATTDDVGGLGTSELDEQLTEQVAGASQAAAADEEAPQVGDARPRHSELSQPEGVALPVDAPAAKGSATNLSHLPVHHPRRVRQALRWRRKWAQRRARRLVSRQVRRVRSLTDGTRHLPSTVVSSSLRPRKDAISWEFTLAATSSRTVNAVFATADVVVPVDQRSQKAAWILARRHAAPEVIVTLPAAARAVASRREVS
jgi:hypothetical protein